MTYLHRRTLSALLALALGATLVSGRQAEAQSVEEFYADNDITLMVGTAPGGSTDLFARLVAPYLTKYLPGHPDIIVQNKPGASGLVTAVELQKVAPKDGTYIATLQRNNYTDRLLKDDKVDFDPREVESLGSISNNTYLIYNHGAKARTLEDLKNKEMILACTGAGATNVTLPMLLNVLAGTKFNCISGYKGTEEQLLAIERGEADGRATGFTTTARGPEAAWLADGKLHFIVVFTRERLAALPDVPAVFELLPDDEARQMFNVLTGPDAFGRPFAAPGGIPADRLAALREAFAKTAADPEFIAQLEANGETIDFMSGEDIQAEAAELMATPPELVAKIKEMLAK